MNRRAIFFLLALASLPTPCLAWGAEGHRIVALIAADQLTPAAKAQVQQLLGSDDAAAGMMAVSTWADEIRRNRPNTAPWHFTDIPIGSAGYDARRDCPRAQCSVAQIEAEEKTLADRQLIAPIRAEALRFLIHFIGDIHQPLHSANNADRGGNEDRVVLGKRHTNLHAVWDVDVVRALGRSPDEVAARLEHQISDRDRMAWQRGTVVDWVNESFRIAKQDIYAKFSGIGPSSEPIVLLPNYARAQMPVVEIQLEKAGVRLAAVLNAVLQ